MIRTVISVVLFVLLIVGCFWIYKIVTHDQVPGNGEVLVRSSPERDQMETGATYIGDKPVEAHPTPSRSDAPGTINTDPASEYGKELASTNPQTASTTQPVPVSPQAYNKPAVIAPYPQQNPASPYTTSSVASTDSIAPNPPNGLAFAGTGPYQWYRQGDLTWRVDTKSGASCVNYATMEEWSKPIVYSHGCGSLGRFRRGRVRN